MSAAQSITSVDNGEIRVTTWTFGAHGASTGRHRHEFDYVVVPVTGGTFVVTDADGSVRQMSQTAGAPYLGVAGTTHDVASTPGSDAVFVEIELKR
jgi:hypothetical protein